MGTYQAKRFNPKRGAFVIRGRRDRQAGVPRNECPWPDGTTHISRVYRRLWLRGWDAMDRHLEQQQADMRYAARGLVTKYPCGDLDKLESDW